LLTLGCAAVLQTRSQCTHPGCLPEFSPLPNPPTPIPPDVTPSLVPSAEEQEKSIGLTDDDDYDDSAVATDPAAAAAGPSGK
jgi:hypothetical protein